MSVSGDIPEAPAAPRWLFPATVAIIIEILVNIAIIWYLLWFIPHNCALFAAESAGRSGCALQTGAWVVAGISALLVLAGIILLFWWHTKKETIRKKPGC
jgi:hypothetical protein